MEFSAAMLPDDAGRCGARRTVAARRGPTPVLIRGGVVEDVSRAARDDRRPDGIGRSGCDRRRAAVRNRRAREHCRPNDSSPRSTCRRSRPRRDLRHLGDRARDRGARARRLQARRRNPRQARAAHRRRDPLGRAGKRRRRAAQGGADRGRPVVAISRSRDRARRRDLHQDRAARERRLGRRDRRALGFELEQSRARSRAGGEQPRRHPRRDARQRRQPARFRRPQRAAARQGQGQ